MASELIQNVVEIMESAHHYRYELAEVADEIKFLQDQVAFLYFYRNLCFEQQMEARV